MIHTALQPVLLPCLVPPAVYVRSSLAGAVVGLFATGEQGVWYDPSDLRTLFQDSAGTTPVTAVGQPVGLMQDKSGRGNHARQATAASRPVLQIDGNGKYYLAVDGVDDGMATGSIDFTATNKMTMWAGVRKLSDAARGVVCELSASVSSNPGAFRLEAPGSLATTGFNASTRGVLGNIDVGIDDPAPRTSVISVAYDLTKTTRLEVIKLRDNGVLGGLSGGIQNPMGGNYGNYPLYIGRRGGGSLTFNGNFYGLIVRGAASTGAQIAAAESYMNSKTGAY